jgi:hypothetical protein
MTGDIDLLKLLDEDDDDFEDEKSADDKIAELTEIVSDLKNENKGLLKAKQDEKRKRQEHQSKLSKIEEKLNAIIESKNKTTQTVESITDKGLTLEFTEDGVPFVPKDKLTELVDPTQEKIKDLEKQIQAAITSGQAAMQADKFVRDVLSEDERYPAVYKKYKDALKWVENKVIDYQNENDLRGKLTSAQAMDLVFKPNPKLKEEFINEFEDMSLISVIIAQDSEEFFRSMLDSNLPKNKTNDDNVRFNKVRQKPSSLVNSPKSSKGDELSVVDKLDSLSTTDIYNLKDTQINSLLEALREEEVGG